jgi:hypothetical protein
MENPYIYSTVDQPEVTNIPNVLKNSRFPNPALED